MVDTHRDRGQIDRRDVPLLSLSCPLRGEQCPHVAEGNITRCMRTKDTPSHRRNITRRTRTKDTTWKEEHYAAYVHKRHHVAEGTWSGACAQKTPRGRRNIAHAHTKDIRGRRTLRGACAQKTPHVAGGTLRGACTQKTPRGGTLRMRTIKTHVAGGTLRGACTQNIMWQKEHCAPHAHKKHHVEGETLRGVCAQKAPCGRRNMERCLRTKDTTWQEEHCACAH
jgi:hypothetical protein